MKRLSTAAVAAFFVLVANGALDACGDKFLVVGSGAPQGYAAPNPARILVVRHGKKAEKSPLDDVRLEGVFSNAGHNVKMVVSPAGVAQALAKNDFDIVLTDIADAKQLETIVA